jgi:hypothetical protein
MKTVSTRTSRNALPVHPSTVPQIFTDADRRHFEQAFAALVPLAQAHAKTCGPGGPDDHLKRLGERRHYGGFSIELRIEYRE